MKPGKFEKSAADKRMDKKIREGSKADKKADARKSKRK